MKYKVLRKGYFESRITGCRNLVSILHNVLQVGMRAVCVVKVDEYESGRRRQGYIQYPYI
jgi:hypothetical protein